MFQNLRVNIDVMRVASGLTCESVQKNARQQQIMIQCMHTDVDRHINHLILMVRTIVSEQGLEFNAYCGNVD